MPIDPDDRDPRMCALPTQTHSPGARHPPDQRPWSPSFDVVVFFYFFSRVVTQFASHFKVDLPLRALTLITHSHAAVARFGHDPGTLTARLFGPVTGSTCTSTQTESRESLQADDGLHRLQSTHVNHRFHVRCVFSSHDGPQPGYAAVCETDKIRSSHVARAHQRRT